MSKLDGIKDFIEDNKEVLEKMNQEMKASYGREPLVWLTVEEAKRVQNALYELLRNSNDKNSREWLTYWMVNGRIEQAEGKCSSE